MGRGFVDKKLPKIRVHEKLSSAELWPLAIMMRPNSAFAAWHVFAVAKNKADALPLIAHYDSQFQLGVWAIVDRKSGVVIMALPSGSWVAPE